jgi:hypothetical protein
VPLSTPTIDFLKQVAAKFPVTLTDDIAPTVSYFCPIDVSP